MPRNSMPPDHRLERTAVLSSVGLLVALLAPLACTATLNPSDLEREAARNADGAAADGSTADPGLGSCPDGETQSRERYQAARVPYDARCAGEVQNRTCVAGRWGQWSGSFAASSCAIDTPKNCGTAAHAGRETRRWGFPESPR